MPNGAWSQVSSSDRLDDEDELPGSTAAVPDALCQGCGTLVEVGTGLAAVDVLAQVATVRACEPEHVFLDDWSVRCAFAALTVQSLFVSVYTVGAATTGLVGT